MIRRRAHRNVPPTVDAALDEMRDRGYEPWVLDIPRDRKSLEGMHPLPHLRWVVRGTLTLRVDDEEVKLRTGDLIEATPGTEETILATDENVRIVCATANDASI